MHLGNGKHAWNLDQNLPNLQHLPGQQIISNATRPSTAQEHGPLLPFRIQQPPLPTMTHSVRRHGAGHRHRHRFRRLSRPRQRRRPGTRHQQQPAPPPACQQAGEAGDGSAGKEEPAPPSVEQAFADLPVPSWREQLTVRAFVVGFLPRRRVQRHPHEDQPRHGHQPLAQRLRQPPQLLTSSSASRPSPSRAAACSGI